MDDLLAEFVAETREMLQAMEGEIVAWEADPGDRARLDAIFRFVHTVKGNCGFFDFPRLERLSHAAESVLAEVRADRRQADAALVTAVLSIIDRIAAMADAIEAGDDFPEGGDEDLIAALEEDAAESGIVAEKIGSVATFPDARSNVATPRTIRLPVELLDQVMSGVSDLVLSRNDLARRLRDTGGEDRLGGPFERLTATLWELRESVSRMRMQRVEHLFNAFPRLVRDLSAELGKQVVIDLDGTSVELDREMIEMVRDPLTHIIRNALDHGIETPAQRLSAGKREIATLGISARQSGNTIIITISDDGRGIEVDKVGAKAVAAGILSEAELKAMDRTEQLDLIFEPGLSTADEVSAISGRGVGMDVVRSNVEKLGGRINVKSVQGEGTVFFLKLPLTLSIIGGLTVRVADQRMAIPRSYIEEIVHGRSDALEYAEMGDAMLVTFRGKRIRYLDLAEVLGIADTPRRAGALVVVRLVTGTMFALGVDRVLDHEELVIKPLSPAITAAGTYAGITLLDDGKPLLMLDIPRIATERGLILGDRARIVRVEDPRDQAQTQIKRKVMAFTGLDGRSRGMPMELVRRIEAVDRSAIDISATHAQVVIGGEILPLTGHENCTLVDDRVRLLRLSDGERELAYAVADIEDSIELDNPIAAVDADPTIEGVTLLDGRSLQVVDGHWLFAAQHRLQPAQALHRSCRLPLEDDWCRAFLEPMVRAAGYTVIGEGDVPADLVIAFAEDGSVPETHADQRVVYLRAERAPDQNFPESIYRYDRESLLSALNSGGRR